MLRIIKNNGSADGGGLFGNVITSPKEGELSRSVRRNHELGNSFPAQGEERDSFRKRFRSLPLGRELKIEFSFSDFPLDDSRVPLIVFPTNADLEFDRKISSSCPCRRIDEICATTKL